MTVTDKPENKQLLEHMNKQIMDLNSQISDTENKIEALTKLVHHKVSVFFLSRFTSMSTKSVF